MVHVADAFKVGTKKFLFVLLIPMWLSIAVATVQQLGICEVWVAFGTGNHFRYVAIHEIVESLGPMKSLSLPVFHPFTGCDTVSSFANIGKKTAWKVWETHAEVTSAFYELHKAPENISKDEVEKLEQFTILMYDRILLHQ